MKLFSLFFFLLSSLIKAEIYTPYALYGDSDTTKNYFFDNNFDEIIRFEPILFNTKELDDKSKKSLDKISQKIDFYKDAKRNFHISIIGHTKSTTDDKNEKKIDSDTYANKIQNIFRDTFDQNASIHLSKSYAQKVKQYLIGKNIDDKIISLEYRGGLDSAYSNETAQSRSLSNRVMVTLYIDENLDLDDDGVPNSKDYCPNTKKGVIVAKNGCKFKTLILLVENNKDHNAIDVSTQQGSQLIDQPNDYTFVNSKSDTPRLYKSMSDEEIQHIFPDLLHSNELKKYTIYFNGTNALNEEKQLAKIKEFLSTKKSAIIHIIGHTDTKGTETFNDNLAQLRANHIAHQIKNLGLDYLKMEIESYGEYNLAVKTPDGVREAKNRRVEILIR